MSFSLGEKEAVAEYPNSIFKRYFTTNNYTSPDFGIKFVPRTAHITDAKGETVFHQDNVFVPEFWSQTAVNILAQKYFRKTGVPNKTIVVPEIGLPITIARRVPYDGAVFGGENDFRQVVLRMVGHWVYTAWKEGYFQIEDEAIIFADELKYMLYMQMAAPNSPQFFNTGLYWAYGITGNGNNDHYAKSGVGNVFGTSVYQVDNSYERPQIHACFINDVEDELIGPNGIMGLLQKEARIFKYGSGSGCNYSKIRGKDEPLSGGGKSSGLLSFLKIGDAVGGAIKSGGTTRRASRMVIVDDDHPDLIEFVEWKVKEEEKAQALIAGSKALNEVNGTFPIYSSAFEGEAYSTISGQNANNSVNVSGAFMNAVKHGGGWGLLDRVRGPRGLEVCHWHTAASDVLYKIAAAAWQCGDPGLFFGDTINEWNTCRNDEKIRACNPCAEYLWFTDTACNLASLNLLAFYDIKHYTTFDIYGFLQATTLWTTVLDISVTLAGYPSRKVAAKSLEYRTLGLGYTNLGALLMVMGLPYDSVRARNIASDITALLTGQAYLTSAHWGSILGAFPAYKDNISPMASVLTTHALALYNDSEDRIEELFQEADYIWREVCFKTNFRNAQVTVLAPTGTISFVMDAQTTGVEPEFALVKYKALAGGGQLIIVNQAVERALESLGYELPIRNEILDFIREHGSIDGCTGLNSHHRDIFACANTISPDGHTAMLGAIQPFVSGGISKTINLPHSATVEDIIKIYKQAWEMGLKCVSVYRDGCKSAQPLTKHEKSSIPSGNLDKINVSVELGRSQFEARLKDLEATAPYKHEIVHFHKHTAPCPTCGHELTVQAGVCHICPVCGSTTGCS
jgi:ribonucleoside-diphosphate reductase alpha chain